MVKRMLSSDVLCSDAFLDLHHSAQALYVQLVMEADDDGIIDNVRSTMRVGGYKASSMTELTRSHLVIKLDSGLHVIKHWHIHNTIRKDRYKPSKYADNAGDLLIKPNKAYSLTSGNPYFGKEHGMQSGNQTDGTAAPDGGETSDNSQTGGGRNAPNGTHRLGKDRLGESRDTALKSGIPSSLQPSNVDLVGGTGGASAGETPAPPSKRPANPVCPKCGARTTYNLKERIWQCLGDGCGAAFESPSYEMWPS